MTATAGALALFRAGFAESWGAYNRSLTPWGFQSERRSFWDRAGHLYTKSGRVPYTTRIRSILLMHGGGTNNTGVPDQSSVSTRRSRGTALPCVLVMPPERKRTATPRARRLLT